MTTIPTCPRCGRRLSERYFIHEVRDHYKDSKPQPVGPCDHRAHDLADRALELLRLFVRAYEMTMQREHVKDANAILSQFPQEELEKP